jgi:hypothetical protein
MPATILPSTLLTEINAVNDFDIESIEMKTPKKPVINKIR